MKKIRMYLYTLILALVSIFVMHSNNLFAMEEVVINPNSNGEATYIFNVKEQTGTNEKGEPEYTLSPKQFARSRNVVVKLILDEEGLNAYDSKFEICEVIPENNAGNTRETRECSTYLTSKSTNSIQLRGRGDGEKVVEINLYSNYASNSIAKTISKSIFLDTTGPVITLNGGEYLYLTSDEKYQELGATCTDANSVEGYTCEVVIEKVNIDMKNPNFQYITYTATDFLGNETNVYRKVNVEQKKKKDYTGWIYGGAGIVVLIAALTYVVIRNKEKQKNQSVL